jgi:uncharacterized protein (DUF952 family)
MDNQAYVIHICTLNAWEAAQEENEYHASSLETEGFIHCSRPEQLLWVANHFYQDVPDLVLLWIDSHKLTVEIKYELGVKGSEERFPHIYGPVNLDAIVAIYDFVPDSDRVYKEIPGLFRYGH